MNNSLIILLLALLALPLCGAEGGPVRPELPPPPPGSMELVSYVHLGVEVKGLNDDEYAALRDSLAPAPQGNYSLVPGEPAFLNRRGGLLVTRIVPGGPADKAGMKEGDLMLFINAALLNTPADLLMVLRNSAAGVPLHMTAIRDGKWIRFIPRPEARPQPVVVGYIKPRQLCPEHLEELKRRQAKVAGMLAETPVPLKEACDEMEAICLLLHEGYTPGSLRLKFRSEACCITATRQAWEIDILMEEGGKATKAQLRPQGDSLPEAIRHRLREMAGEDAP